MIIYLAGVRKTANAHYVAYRRMPTGDHNDLNFKAFIKIDDSKLVGPPLEYENFRDIGNIYMLMLERN